MIKLLLAISVLALVSCSTMVKVPDVPTDYKTKPMDAWTKVLNKYVDAEGRVDFGALKDNLADLSAYVSYVAKNGPKSTPQAFPNANDVLAHYLNSYNALAMYGIIQRGIPESLSGFTKVKFFYFTKFVIDGQTMSLYAYENDIIRKVGEERVHFALNCMTSGCPRLPRTPFTAKGLDQELNREALKFFNEDRNVRVETAEKKVFVSEILDFFTEDFLKKEKTLNAYVNRYRKAKVPEDFKVKFIDYDWTVWNQSLVKK